MNYATQAQSSISKACVVSMPFGVVSNAVSGKLDRPAHDRNDLRDPIYLNPRSGLECFLLSE